MKKILLSVLILVTLALSADVYRNPGLDVGQKPIDSKKYVIADSDLSDAYDTIATTDFLLIGPFPACASTNEPQFKGLGILAKELPADDSLFVEYQLTRGEKDSDTLANMWSVVDTIDEKGSRGYYVDISDEVGHFIFFKIYNPTGAAVILKETFAYLRRNYTYEKTK